MMPYFDRRDEIYEEDGLLFLSNKLIIPEKERNFTVQGLHQGNFGKDKTKSFARYVIYWSGTSRQIKETVSKGKICQKFQCKQVKEPFHQHDIPDRLWQKVGVDSLIFVGRAYLIVVGYFSKYPEVA